MKVFTFAVAIVAFVAVSASNDEEGEMIHGDAASLVSGHHNKVSDTLLLMLFLNLHS